MSDSGYDRRDRNPADTELKFFGAITASVTHELNNVISIINQVGGLLEDLSYGVSQGQEIKPEQMQKITDRISHQTERGIGIIKRLNTFAHTVDEPVAEFDICALMENLVALSERLATLAGVRLTVQLGDEPVLLTGNRLKIQQVVFLALKSLLKIAAKDARLEISVHREEKGASINLDLAMSEMGVTPEVTLLKTIVGQIEAEMEFAAKPDKTIIKIILPHRAGFADNTASG